MKYRKILYTMCYVTLTIAILASATSAANSVEISEYYPPTEAHLVCGLVSSSDNHLWFIKSSETNSQIVKSSIDGQMTEYQIPLVDNSYSNSHICSTSAGLNGDIWLIGVEKNKEDGRTSNYIRRVTSSGSVQTIPIFAPISNINMRPKILADINFVNESEIWLTLGVGNDSEGGGEPYTMLIKTNSSGDILDSYEESGVNPLLESVNDSQKNKYFIADNKLFRINPSGSITSTELDETPWQQISEFLGWGLRSRLALDSNDNLWFYSMNMQDQRFIITMINTDGATNNILLPSGVVPLTQLQPSKDKKVWYILSRPENSKISNYHLEYIDSESRIINSGKLSLNTGDIITTSTLGPDQNLWAIVSNFSEATSNVRLVKIELEKSTETPMPPKTGNVAVFIVISSLVVSSALLFSAYIHQKHLKSKVATR